MTFIQIQKGAVVTTADGRPAYERGGFVTQAMIDQYGSYQKAREALARQKGEKPCNR